MIELKTINDKEILNILFNQKVLQMKEDCNLFISDMSRFPLIQQEDIVNTAKHIIEVYEELEKL